MSKKGNGDAVRRRNAENRVAFVKDKKLAFTSALLLFPKKRKLKLFLVFSGALRVRVLTAPPLKNKNNVVKRQRRFCGRGDAIRTRNLWFWRPLLYR